MNPADERDRAHMRRALSLAAEGLGQTAPNPMVGAVLAWENEIVGEGFHERFGAAHAEVNAIAAAGERARGAHLYVTLEPCRHRGKTPPCTDAIVGAGISAVTIAAPDPTPAASGGAEILRRAGIAVRTGVEEAAARELNAWFYHAAVSPRPWTTLKLAISLDGAIAESAARESAASRPRWLTGETARAEVHRLRAGSDAIAVGVGTVIADDPQLTVRHWRLPRRPPLRVVFDRHARTPLAAVLVRTATEIPTVAVVEREDLPGVEALAAAGVEIVAAPSMESALEALRRRGVMSLLVEGGATLAGSLIDAGCLDRLVLMQAPVILGNGALNAFSAVTSGDAVWRRLRVLDRRELEDDVVTVYSMERS